MLVVWILGLMLATHLGIWDEHWFQAKLALVVALSGYQGWLTIDSLELPERASAAFAGAKYLRGLVT